MADGGPEDLPEEEESDSDNTIDVFFWQNRGGDGPQNNLLDDQDDLPIFLLDDIEGEYDVPIVLQIPREVHDIAIMLPDDIEDSDDLPRLIPIPRGARDNPIFLLDDIDEDDEVDWFFLNNGQMGDNYVIADLHGQLTAIFRLMPREAGDGVSILYPEVFRLEDEENEDFAMANQDFQEEVLDAIIIVSDDEENSRDSPMVLPDDEEDEDAPVIICSDEEGDGDIFIITDEEENSGDVDEPHKDSGVGCCSPGHSVLREDLRNSRMSPTVVFQAHTCPDQQLQQVEETWTCKPRFSSPKRKRDIYCKTSGGKRQRFRLDEDPEDATPTTSDIPFTSYPGFVRTSSQDKNSEVPASSTSGLSFVWTSSQDKDSEVPASSTSGLSFVRTRTLDQDSEVPSSSTSGLSFIRTSRQDEDSEEQAPTTSGLSFVGTICQDKDSEELTPSTSGLSSPTKSECDMSCEPQVSDLWSLDSSDSPEDLTPSWF